MRVLAHFDFRYVEKEVAGQMIRLKDGLQVTIEDQTFTAPTWNRLLYKANIEHFEKPPLPRSKKVSRIFAGIPPRDTLDFHLEHHLPVGYQAWYSGGQRNDPGT
jgi:hypothetical protein